MAESREKTRKRGRRNTISDFDLSNEKGLDIDQLRCSRIISPEYKKKKEDEENTEPKEMMTFDEMNENEAIG